MSLGEALRSPQFIILIATNFFCCATHSGPIIHTVSYAISCGIPLVAAVTIYSVEGFAGLFGRIAFGIAGDRLGAKRVLVAGLLVQAFGALAYVFVRELAAFYAVAAVFGFIYAGTMPLYSVIIRENFPIADVGHGHRRHLDGRQPRHGDRALGRRSDLRHLCELRLALYRLLGLRARRLCDRADVQAVPESAGAARAGAGIALPVHKAVPSGFDCGTVLDESAHSLRPVGSRCYFLCADTVSDVGLAPMEDAHACFREADEPGRGKPLQRLPGGAIEDLRLQN